jgi:hypothetical protein
VLRGTKKLLPQHDIVVSKVPKWEELGIKYAYAKLSKDADFMQHMPDDKGLPERDFFWGVSFTLRNNFCLEFIAEARKHRENHGVVKVKV